MKYIFHPVCLWISIFVCQQKLPVQVAVVVIHRQLGMSQLTFVLFVCLQKLPVKVAVVVICLQLRMPQLTLVLFVFLQKLPVQVAVVIRHQLRTSQLYLLQSQLLPIFVSRTSDSDLTIFILPDLSSERDYVITHSVRSMYVCMCVPVYVVCMWYFTKLITVSTLGYSHRTWTQWSLGRVTHVTSTYVGSKVIWGSMTFGTSFW